MKLNQIQSLSKKRVRGGYIWEGRSGRLTIPIRAAFNKKLKPKKDFFRKIEVNLHRHFHSTPFKRDLTEVTQLHFKLFFTFLSK